MTTTLEHGKTSEELRRERELRVTNAIHLRPTDRVPIICSLGYFVARYAGIPCSAAYYDPDAWLAAYRKTLGDFQPDMSFTQPFFPGTAMEYLNPRFRKWPGHGVAPNHGHQAIEIESLRDDEHDYFLHKPADFCRRNPQEPGRGHLDGGGGYRPETVEYAACPAL